MNQSESTVANEEKTSVMDQITQGGDRRIHILPDLGTNKYFVNPTAYKGLLNRGSCTCSALNPETEALLTDLESADTARLYKWIRSQLRSLLNFPGEDRFDVFLAPSGSDLTYYPLLFSQLLHPDQEILSLVSCPEELGSGTIKAASGKYFMDLNQFNEDMPQGENLFESGPVETLKFSARGEDGEILEHKHPIIEAISEIHGRSMIGYLVVGSKSGIENDIDIVREVDKKVMWVVDLCQFRNRKVFINELLDLGCTVMITGSKFYQSPPFCGALLVPKAMSDKMSKLRDIDFSPYQRLFSQNDIPPRLAELRSKFRSHQNKGLALRWCCALHEMTAFDQIPYDESDALISEWNQVTSDAISAADNLELMPDQQHTNSSIISFRAKYQGRYLRPEETQRLFELIVRQKHSGFKKFDRVFIGQPVLYGDKSFIRVALGSYNVRRLILTGADWHNDHHLISLLSEHVPRAVGSRQA